MVVGAAWEKGSPTVIRFMFRSKNIWERRARTFGAILWKEKESPQLMIENRPNTGIERMSNPRS